ncbi:MAG: hypothetical protein AABM42_02355 [Actinomycetota bacterium]
MSGGWSIFTHADLPPLPGHRPGPPAGRFPDGQVPRAPELPPIEAERIRRQGKVARAVRHAADRVPDRRRRQMLTNRALLIEVAGSADEVVELLDEVRRLGVRIRRRAQ